MVNKLMHYQAYTTGRTDSIGFVPQGVIFDVDDTLLDNYPSSQNLGLHEHARLLAIREIGEKYSIPLLKNLSVEANKTVIQRSKEHTIDGSVWQLFYELGLVDTDDIDHADPLLTEIVRRKQELYQPILAEFGAPLPKAVEFVQAMYVLTDGRIAIASSGHRQDIDAFLRITGLDDYFASEHIISKESVDRAKPDPEPFDRAFKALGLADSARGHVVAFEDDPKGIESAKHAGLFVAAITSRYTSDALYAHQPAPDIVADHYVDFAEIFGIML